MAGRLHARAATDGGPLTLAAPRPARSLRGRPHASRQVEDVIVREAGGRVARPCRARLGLGLGRRARLGLRRALRAERLARAAERLPNRRAAPRLRSLERLGGALDHTTPQYTRAARHVARVRTPALARPLRASARPAREALVRGACAYTKGGGARPPRACDDTHTPLAAASRPPRGPRPTQPRASTTRYRCSRPHPFAWRGLSSTHRVAASAAPRASPARSLAIARLDQWMCSEGSTDTHCSYARTAAA